MKKIKEVFNKLNKKQVLLVVGILLLLSLFILVAKLSQKTVSNPVEQPVQNTADVEKVNMQAVGQGDESICTALLDLADRENCREQVIGSKAAIEKDSTLCEQLSTTEKVTLCKDNVVASKAIQSMDSSVCTDSSSSRAQARCEQMVKALKSK